jgi:hypothetical protein
MAIHIRTLVALCASSICAACNDGPVSNMTWHMTRAELRRAAAAGFPARVVLEEEGAGVAAPNETRLVLGAHGLHVLPAPAFAPFTNAGFDAWLFRTWVAPYLDVSDVDGAVRAAVRGYTRALESQHAIEKSGPLPPLPAPNQWAFTFPSRNADWGLPLSAMVLALGIALEHFARRDSRFSSTARK